MFGAAGIAVCIDRKLYMDITSPEEYPVASGWVEWNQKSEREEDSGYDAKGEKYEENVDQPRKWAQNVQMRYARSCDTGVVVVLVPLFNG